MSLSMANGASGATFFQESLDVVTHNIASMERAGFREEFLIGASNDYVQEKGAGSLSSTNGNIVPAGIQKGQGVRAVAVVSKLTQGRLNRTDNPYHIAIQGKGFFQIEMPDGTLAYTRDGTFSVNAERNLVTQMGYVVAPAISVPENAEYITINRTGKVQAKIAGQNAMQDVGDMEIVTFANEEGLRKIEDNLLLETDASGVPTTGIPAQDSRGHLLQGHYEASNVDMVSQVTKLIKIQRAYEMNIKSIKTENELLSGLNNI
ncbi:MAG: flagellar hook-basal body complex protein [Alphaproteobacteria bacterium]|nr:flagellar hook-basal body complex protein [Alphaproteobacteria bacterium]NCQ67157.1 flagellar hook-basal body complex protein [Alphaproteobacteria bacterium]NCT07753.1 flagellar hook-basal body complex protein [Alphaproteobacteria bacterium]